MNLREILLGVVANEQGSHVAVKEFELQSYYYVPFWTNTVGKGMSPSISQAMG